MSNKLKDVLLGFLIAVFIFGAHEAVTMNQKHWCEVEYKSEPRYIAECTVVSNGLARVSFK